MGTSVAIFALTIFVVVSCAAAYVLAAGATRFVQTAETRALEARGAGLAAAFQRDLGDLWGALGTVAATVPAEPGEIAVRLATFAATRPGVDRVALADLDGHITDASDGRTGHHVAHTRWFTEGLDRPLARERAERPALVRVDGQRIARHEPRRTLELARPIRNAAGEATGVLMARVDLGWAESRLRGLAQVLGIEAVLVSGGAGAAFADRSGTQASLPSLQAAGLGIARAYTERTADGSARTAVVLTDLEVAGMPPLGWSILARMPVGALASLAGELPNLIKAAAVTFGITMLLTLVYVATYVRPLKRLAASAVAVAAGREVYPFESRRTREIADLSSALGLLQASVQHVPSTAPAAGADAAPSLFPASRDPARPRNRTPRAIPAPRTGPDSIGKAAEGSRSR